MTTCKIQAQQTGMQAYLFIEICLRVDIPAELSDLLFQSLRCSVFIDVRSDQNLHFKAKCGDDIESGYETTRQALLQFKHGLIDRADQFASWVGDEKECCKWAGIQVPSFIGSFGNLRYLNLSSSEFGGTVPLQLGNLLELRDLCLGSFYDKTFGSEHTSMLNMQWLSSLRSLHHLDMSGVYLSKAIDWLQSVDGRDWWVAAVVSEWRIGNNVVARRSSCTSQLDFPSYTKAIPKSLRNLCNLTRLSGHLPDSIGRLSFLKSLSLGENLIFGSIAYSIGRLSSLEMLDV
ncbi:hypothetical protein L6452_12420 [Arctium lappa]|uniref:Uncharacterized protein n=1 Tax=Arctium lappa TaxID=4217 RepID=A0ACB9DR40_ARCLA|nr:hypothetical protein L6452_12420 [Arctium lappa]